MAQRVQVLLVDDLDGASDADETVSFSLDGANYEIDLTTNNAQALRDALALYVGSARRAGGRKSRGRGTRSSAASPSGTSTAEVRAWARENGYEVNDRGRVPATIVEAYQAAN